MPAAHHQNGRVPVGVRGRGGPAIEPVGTAKVPGIGFAGGSRSPHLLRERLQPVQRGEQRPGLESAAVGGIGGKPEHAAAASLCRLEFEDRLDGLGARRVTLRGGVRSGSSSIRVRPDRPACVASSPAIEAEAAHRLDIPGEGQQIAPIRSPDGRGRSAVRVRPGQSVLELSQPVLRMRGERLRARCFRHRQHRARLEHRGQTFSANVSISSLSSKEPRPGARAHPPVTVSPSPRAMIPLKISVVPPWMVSFGAISVA